VHLNPKIGLDWMGHGQQKEAMTPGQNEKRYLAGAQDVRTGQIYWVEAKQKNSYLFWDLLYTLTKVYAQATVIHVILDNYGIHSSNILAWREFCVAPTAALPAALLSRRQCH
jgi:hypothetical protein